MNDCETCKELRERAEYFWRINYWQAELAWKQYLQHLMTEHAHQTVETREKQG